MDCREARDLLQQELDGRLPASDAGPLAEHVASCPDCAEERRALASLRARFRAVPRAAAPAGFRDDVLRALPSGRVVPLRRIIAAVVGVAAVALVAITFLPREFSSATSVEKEVAARDENLERDRAPAAAKVTPSAPALRAGEERQESADKADAKDAPSPGVARGGARAATETSKAKIAANRVAGDRELLPPTPPAGVRYVVFRDAAAANAFAERLARRADEKRRSEAERKAPVAKEESAPPAPTAPAEPTADDAASALAAKKLDDEVLVPVHVIARRTVASADVDLALLAGETGGAVVSRLDGPGFGAPGFGAPSTGAAAPPAAAGKSSAQHAAADAGFVVGSGEANVTVVILVLDERQPVATPAPAVPPAPAPAPRKPR